MSAFVVLVKNRFVGCASRTRVPRLPIGPMDRYRVILGDSCSWFLMAGDRVLIGVSAGDSVVVLGVTVAGNRVVFGDTVIAGETVGDTFVLGSTVVVCGKIAAFESSAGVTCSVGMLSRLKFVFV